MKSPTSALYHYPCNDDFEFCGALADYLKSLGRCVPASLARGEPPAEGRGPHGKPYFTGPGLEGVFFSRSDTRGCVAVGFSSGEIGVDCENIEARKDIETRYQEIAKRFFTEDEQEYIAAGASGAIERFFGIWTAKEAYMKYTGGGFSEGFLSFSALKAPGVRIVTGRFEDMPHIVYSVCAEDTGASFRVACAYGRG